jgi:hypothetical protein
MRFYLMEIYSEMETTRFVTFQLSRENGSTLDSRFITPLTFTITNRYTQIHSAGILTDTKEEMVRMYNTALW